MAAGPGPNKLAQALSFSFAKKAFPGFKLRHFSLLSLYGERGLNDNGQ